MIDVNKLTAQQNTVQATRDLQSFESAARNADAAQSRLGQTMRTTQNDFSATSRLSNSFSQSLLGLATGATNARGALASLLNSAARTVWRDATSSRSSGGGLLGNLLGGLFNAKGNAFAGGNVTAFANGGVVNGPTAFNMGGAQIGVMGEAGAEAVMPLRRMANGRLGVEANGGKAPGQTVYLDARGADVGAVARIERALQALNASVERRAVDAISDRFDRDPAYIRR